MDEALHWFKINIVQDKQALSGALNDHIQEEFKAHLHGLHQLSDDGVICGAVYNYACLGLNQPVVCMLAGLTFPEDLREDWQLFHENTIKLVDAWWE